MNVTDKGLERARPFLYGVLSVEGCSKISAEEIESIKNRRGFSDEFLPGIINDFDRAKHPAWRPVQFRNGAVLDPAIYLYLVPMLWLDESSDRVKTYLGLRRMILKSNHLDN